jgi:hypothetical protein
MARPLRLEYPGTVFHVMNRGLARRATFRTPADSATFLQVPGETRTLWGGGGLRLLSDGESYHLCLCTPVGNLGRVMRHLNGVYPQRFNRAHRRNGPLVRGRYKAILVEAEAYLGLFRIFEDGVRRLGGVLDWSSHSSFIGGTALAFCRR